jgi:hypothetical protein
MSDYDEIVDAYARIPSSVEIIPRRNRQDLPRNIVINDNNCLICGKHVAAPRCKRCGFVYCKEHSDDAWHKCLLPKNKTKTNNEMRDIAIELRNLLK